MFYLYSFLLNQGPGYYHEEYFKKINKDIFINYLIY